MAPQKQTQFKPNSNPKRSLPLPDCWGRRSLPASFSEPSNRGPNFTPIFRFSFFHTAFSSIGFQQAEVFFFRQYHPRPPVFFTNSTLKGLIVM
jgi:hypothetical protein